MPHSNARRVTARGIAELDVGLVGLKNEVLFLFFGLGADMELGNKTSLCLFGGDVLLVD